MTASPTPPFLDEQNIARGGAEAGLDEAALGALRDLARRIAGDPELLRAAAATHHTLFETGADFDEAVRQADDLFGADANLLHALFVLDSIRLVHQRQAARGVPESISRAVNDRHGAAWLREAARRGAIGLEQWHPGWLRTVASGELYRLGRLEFVPEVWEHPFRVYTHTRTRKVIVLAEAGQRFTGDGLLVGDQAWEATLIETDDAIVGTPISPRGVALQQVARLPCDEWQRAIEPGDPIIDIHVPAEGALSIEALRDAFARAESFFGEVYPERRFVAYVCDSWLFSPQLEAMLGAASNIVRWQHEGYLLPSDDGADAFLAFTFGSGTIDTSTAPRDTRLRRAIIAHLDQGGTLRAGTFLLLRGNLDRFGSQPYREASELAIAHVTVAA